MVLDERVDNEEIKRRQKYNAITSGAFTLTDSRRINSFICVIEEFELNIVYYEDTDGLYIEKKNWHEQNDTGLVGKNLCPAKDDFKEGGSFFFLFLPA